MSEGSSDSIAAWPSTLPLPYVDYQGNPFHVTATSPADTPKIARRNRYISAVVNVAVQWVLNTDEYEDFKVFFEDDLDMGVALFRIELRYPYNNSLSMWKVRFVSDGYKAAYKEGLWEVSGSLDLLQLIPTVTPEPEVPLDWQPFHVTAEESIGEDNPFVTTDGYAFYVKL